MTIINDHKREKKKLNLGLLKMQKVKV